MPTVDLLHEKPIPRVDAAGNPYTITMSMDPGAADLSRVAKGQVKLLADHPGYAGVYARHGDSRLDRRPNAEDRL